MRYLICLFVLAGCATAEKPKEEKWIKDGASEMEVRAAVRECRIDSEIPIPLFALAHVAAGSPYFAECMTNKGFKRAP